ncbi:MAG: family 43 glycosylhydrolase [Chloroflexota bacterium]
MKNNPMQTYLPNEPSPNKPTDRPLSAASHRHYDKWGLYKDSTNPFYTSFRYSEVTGIGKEAGVTRRDPTTVIKLGNTYYVWYTRRQTKHDRDFNNKPPFREAQAHYVPTFDWDLAEIWFATSNDGFHWQEQGLAVRSGPDGAFDSRSVFTPDILMFKGKYYLYYQAVDYPYTIRTRNAIGMSWADSPEGPWHRFPEPVLTPGEPGEWLDDDDSNNVKTYGDWDSHKVHDPFLLVRGGKVWLYYKGQPMGWGTKYCRGMGWGVAIADQPEGPFVKSPLNPVTNSGHETCLFPYGEGVAAICNHDGPEKDTVQYAADGLNFEVMSHVVLPPCAGGPFAPDSYSDTKDGKGITWGLAHIATEEMKTGNSYIIRFDCDLHREVKRPGFKQSNMRFPEDVYFSEDFILTDDLKAHHNEPPQPLPDSQYPIKPSEAKTNKPLSIATERVYTTYGIYKDQQSEFYSAFKYALVTGVGKETDITRRDPTKVIKVNDTYYVWYTRRQTAETYRGIENATETIPATDWDLAEIWYATSKDGFHWQEQGVAVTRGPAGEFDDRSVFTPDVLVDDGKYYLYYQTVQAPYTRRAKHQIGLSWAESPDGPWQRWPELILPAGGGAVLVGDDDDADQIAKFGTWDSQKIHDPYVLKRDGKIWLYYKGVGYGRHYRHDLGCAWGVAIADKPEGPFVRSPLNPITNSGHETFLYPYREGVVAVTSLEGPEKNTVQYAPDGLNFEVMGKISNPPIAAGPYVPDAFTDTSDGQGITWGLAHIFQGASEMMGGQEDFENSFLVRFECNLSRAMARDGFYRRWNFRFPEAAYFCRRFKLTEAMKQEAMTLMQTIDRSNNDEQD